MPEEAGTLFDIFPLTGIRYWCMQMGGVAEAALLEQTEQREPSLSCSMNVQVLLPVGSCAC